jgi:hypothetical protein
MFAVPLNLTWSTAPRLHRWLARRSQRLPRLRRSSRT